MVTLKRTLDPDSFCYDWSTMNQIRIAHDEEVAPVKERFSTAWMVASSMNLWLLRARLAEALARHGSGSHWIETYAVAHGEHTPAPQPPDAVKEGATRPFGPYTGRARAITTVDGKGQCDGLG
jgi:hypothetical protein